MILERSRREFLKQGSLLVALSGGVLRTSWAQTGFVEADTAFGRVRGADYEGIKTFKGIPYGATTAGQKPVHAAGRTRRSGPACATRWSTGRARRSASRARRRAARRLAVAAAGLPAEGEDCLVLNVWTPGRRRRPQAAGHVLVPRRRVCDRLGLLARHRRHQPRAPRRRRRRVDQPSSQRAGVHVPGRGSAARLRAVGRRRHARHRARAASGCATNIERFGGDPDTVMIFGQSGGGRKVGTLLAMPSAKGLFHRAIIESGATIKLVERDQAARVARRAAREAGAANAQLRELQSLPVRRSCRAYFAVVREHERGSDDRWDSRRRWTDRVVPQHPFHPTAADGIGGRAADARLDAHRDDARARRGRRSRSTTPACASASAELLGEHAGRDRSTSIARRTRMRRRRTSIS